MYKSLYVDILSFLLGNIYRGLPKTSSPFASDTSSTIDLVGHVVHAAEQPHSEPVVETSLLLEKTQK